MEMRNSLAVLLSFSFVFIFLFGCTAPWESPQDAQNQSAQQQTPPANQTPAIIVNESGGQGGAVSINASGSQGGEGGIDWGEIEGGQEGQNETAAGQGGNQSAQNATNETAVLPDENQSSVSVASRPFDSWDITNGTFGLVKTPDATLNVYVIDVGFGNAVLVNKGTFNMLIDAGPASQGASVASFVSSHGIDALNVVVATHDDINSVGGVPAVLSAMPAQEIWMNNVSYNSTQYDAIWAKIRENAIAVKYPVAKQWIRVNGLNVSVMNPQQQRLQGSSESDAIILRLEYGDFCMVLLDPTVHEIEPALLSSNVPVGKCQVVQYFNRGEGRGGLYGSSALVEGRMNALKDVIISVGPSQFDLPSQTTLDRLAIHGWNIYRTDTGGTITITSDGKNYTISKSR